MDIIVDQFDNSKESILSVGRCECGREGMLIDGECVVCYEEQYPVLKDVIVE